MPLAMDFSLLPPINAALNATATVLLISALETPVTSTDVIGVPDAGETVITFGGDEFSGSVGFLDAQPPDKTNPNRSNVIVPR